MVESTQNRKLKDVESFRMRRYSEREELSRRRELSVREKAELHDRVLEMHEKQVIKKKLLDMARKLNSKDNIEEKLEKYEEMAAKAYEEVEKIKRREAELGKVNEQSSQIFRSIMEDFNRLKKS